MTYAQRYFSTYAGAYNTPCQPMAATPTRRPRPPATRPTPTRPCCSPARPSSRPPATRSFTTPRPARAPARYLRSILNDGSGQYNFKTNIADLTVGGAYRQYLLGSDGTLV